MGAEEIVKEVLNSEVVKEVYKDGVKPTVEAVGNIVALPFQAIDAALSPIKIWVEEKKFNYQKTLELLSEKMKNVPKENIVPPENYVAVPALQQIAYCFDSEELRNMYANLLASSMQKDKKWEVHPGFVEIIKQLSPDEAKIIKKMWSIGREAVITLRAENGKQEGVNIISNVSLIGYKANCEEPLNVAMYIDNLSRLGILNNNSGLDYLTNDKLYEEIYKLDYIEKAKDTIVNRNDGLNIPNFIKGYIELTDFGKSFCKVCVLSLVVDVNFTI